MRLVKKIAVVSALFLPGKYYTWLPFFSFWNGHLIPLCGLLLHTVVLSLNIISFPLRRLALKKIVVNNSFSEVQSCETWFKRFYWLQRNCLDWLHGCWDFFFSVYFSGVGFMVSAFLSEGGAESIFTSNSSYSTSDFCCSGGDELSLGEGEFSKAPELGLEGLGHLNLGMVLVQRASPPCWTTQ